MLPQIDHRFVAEILRDGAQPLTAPLDLDWIPAVEWGRFQHIRHNVSQDLRVPPRSIICPGWDQAAGAPYVSHVDVSFDPSGTEKQTIPLQYFSNAVAHAVNALVEAGTIGAGEPYRWRICAYHGGKPECTKTADDSFEVEECQHPERAPPVIRLDRLLARAQYHGAPPIEGRQPDAPVLFAPQVFVETAEVATAAGTLEAGGILLGRFARDAASGDLFIDITAQIAAREAIADDASLRFTANTWRAVDAAIRLRGNNENILGWWHSHPRPLWPCRNCPPERRSNCPSNRAFFSDMDVGFHRTAFQGGHNVALLLSFHEDDAPIFHLFGWRHGMVCARGYYVTKVPHEH